MKRIKELKCVYCGGDAQDEDHIPSKNLYKGITKNFIPIKVPTCKNCNNTKLSKDEAYFRDFVTGLMYKSSLSATTLFDNSVTRSIRKNPALAIAMFKKMKLVQYYKNGIDFGIKTAVEPDNDRIFNVVRKYIKGLYFHKFNKVIPDDWVIRIYWLNPKLEKTVESFLKGMRWEILDENIFIYGYNYVEETYQSVWCLVFYGKPLFFAFVLDKERS